MFWSKRSRRRTAAWRPGAVAAGTVGNANSALWPGARPSRGWLLALCPGQSTMPRRIQGRVVAAVGHRGAQLQAALGVQPGLGADLDHELAGPGIAAQAEQGRQAAAPQPG